jgi:hypothetical protein
MEGCQGNTQNAKLIRVCDAPSKIPIDASRTQQITYRVKQFMQREHTDQLGKIQRCNERDLRACEEH